MIATFNEMATVLLKLVLSGGEEILVPYPTEVQEDAAASSSLEPWTTQTFRSDSIWS